MTPQRSPRATATPAPEASLTLHDASERLGVHYMTAYRYVRTGRLPATKRDGEWMVDSIDVDSLRVRGAAAAPGRGHTAHGRRIPELVDRLIAGDEPGAWSVVQSVLAGGTSPPDLYMEVLVPALRMVGERWEAAAISVADEHCATAVMHRIIGRTGPLFRRRGRTRGIVVLGAPEGELHGIPTALAADLLRSSGFVVIDLGPNVPTASFVDCVLRLTRVMAVGITVTTADHRPAAARLVAALRDAGVDIPILVGGSGLDEAAALDLGADGWAGHAPQLVDLLGRRPARRHA
ncbi:MAG TPA: B12-binding domain-containing protein [Candidatus Deferrimicrobium sp.]|nr:B12-binding domain-containing protein [Candidatus Deferrimicrobium sp.]